MASGAAPRFMVAGLPLRRRPPARLWRSWWPAVRGGVYLAIWHEHDGPARARSEKARHEHGTARRSASAWAAIVARSAGPARHG
jgi:hypothetical protein